MVMSKRKNDHATQHASTESQSSRYTKRCGATPYLATPSRTTPLFCLSCFCCLSACSFCLVERFVLLSFFLSHLLPDLHIDKNGYNCKRFSVLSAAARAVVCAYAFMLACVLWKIIVYILRLHFVLAAYEKMRSNARQWSKTVAIHNIDSPLAREKMCRVRGHH